ncbi:MAG: TonB-dependent receptor [Sphingomonadales bacterium 35-56-22]|jgi:iron complex outermembrane receptor protein|nr:MAG: TonB-dependent receptor [Sphingomonadales bacterium 35-56-22]OYY97434.1 MAG: TonB-dependent receptor [Sphingomonadales bacterium 28-56-43]OYZ59527.1 MAG: TonB-dependent receptor [Sphingomonadales bacterium 24-56-14]OZA81964.1 MAG: TonB-dependent receptor [Sphingomonadales bacterium 39-57-19]
MRKITMMLLAGVAFGSVPVMAQQSNAPTTADSEEAEIVVFGQGETRQVQEVSSKELLILAPGTSPLKAIEKLPSVSFQSADPFGTYEWSSRVSIRGFNQNQLGYTLDGIPLGDSSYGNNNGLHIGRAIISENIGVTRVSQGSGSIGTQATNNLGGTLEFFSADPSDGFGVDANLTYGSSNTMRAFGRINFGEAGGVRGFLSGVYHNADKWKGGGEQRSMHVNAKAIIPVGDAEFDGFFSYSDRAEQDYQDLSLEMINRLGYDHDNYFPDYAKAISAARGVYVAPINNIDDSYYDASGLRKDTLASYGLTAPLADGVTFKIKAYYHNNTGQGTWGTPYVPSPNGVPMSARTTEYDIQRGGVFSSLNAEVGDHEVTVGGWYEHNDFTQARRFYAYESNTTPGLDHTKFLRNPFFTQWLFDFNTDTLQYYVQDKISLGDLTINLGWKGFQVNNESDPRIQGSLAAGKIKSQDWFQPHAGVAYKMTDKAEIFGGFTQVTRAFVSSATSGPFATTQAGFDALLARGLKPESSDTFELGARYNNNVFNGVIGVYYVNFRNRLLGVQTGAGIVGNPAILQNVGSVRSLGFEAAGDVRLGGGMTLFASYSYTGATYRENVITPTAVIATKGKDVVDTPKHLLRGEVAYDSDAFFGRVGANYMSKRYFNYLNDRSVPGRVLVDATVGYRLDAGLRAPLELQLNATNLFGTDYVSTIGSNGFGNSGDNQTLQAGSPRQVFVTLKAGF